MVSFMAYGSPHEATLDHEVHHPKEPLRSGVLHYVDSEPPRDPMTGRREKVRLLTAAEAAERLRTTPMRIVDLCRSKALPATKPLGRWLIREDDIDELLRNKANTPAPDAVEQTDGGAA